MKSVRSFASFFVNGTLHEISGAKAAWMLSDYLRSELQLCGTKIVCAEGDCGACTVLRWHPYPKKSPSQPKFIAINSCIATVAHMDGSSLVTVEGLKQANKAELTPVQSAMLQCHGSQCGYCTPGFVMALTALTENRLAKKKLDPISLNEAKNYLTGNLCRCTGYEQILNAAQEIPLAKMKSLTESYLTASIRKQLTEISETPFHLQSPQFSFYSPTQFTEAAKHLSKNANCRIIGSTTDLGVQLNKRKANIPSMLSLRNIAAAYEVKRMNKSRIRIGCQVAIAELRRELEKEVPELARFLDIFASPQIKNTATVVGNIVNASPIADTVPFLLVSRAQLHLESSKGKRKLELSDFYLGYKKIALKKGELVTAIEFDIPGSKETLHLFKSSQRKDLDISCVNFALRLIPSSKPNLYSQALFAVGGVAAIPKRLFETEKLFVEEPISKDHIPALLESLQSEITPLSDLRGSSAFRRIVLEQTLKTKLATLADYTGKGARQ